jgi:hypothetical protein
MRRSTFFAASASIAVLSACTDNGANSLSPIGSPAYGVSHVLAGANVPQGSATFYTRSDTTGAPTVVVKVPGTTRDTILPTAPVTDSVRLTLQGLDSLEGTFHYQAWIGDSTTYTFKPAPGLLSLTRTDTVLNAAGEPTVVITRTPAGAASASFQGKGPRTSYLFVTSRKLSGIAPADAFQTLLITIESSTAPTAPNKDRAIIFTRRNSEVVSSVKRAVVVGDSATDRNTRVRFGNYDPDLLKQYVYVAAGRGRIYVRDDVLEVSDSSLSRPPKGYFYGVYGVKRNAQNLPIDTIYFGPLRSPFPRRDLSLREADSVVVDPLIQPSSAQFANGFSPSIIAGGVYVHSKDVTETASATTNPYAGIAQILLSLESKHKTDARLGPSIILTADLPGIIRTPPVATPPATTSLAH